MKKSVVITAIVVVAALIGAGIAIPLLMNGSNNGGGDNQTSQFSFDKHYFDLKGAKSLAIIKDDQSVGSSAMSVASIIGDGSREATLVIGDDTKTLEKSSLYKKDELGNYVKVKMYGDKQSLEEETGEIKVEPVPILIEVTDDGKYAFMMFGKIPVGNNSTSYHELAYVIVSLESGKIYQLPNDHFYSYSVNTSNTDMYQPYSTTLYSMGAGSTGYKYIGNSGSYIFLSTYWNNEVKIYTAIENDGELLLKELINSEYIDNIGPGKLYNNGILRVFSSNMWTNKSSYLVFANGGIKNCADGTIVECGDNICTSVTYYDDATKYFPHTATIITGYDTAAHTFTTQAVEYTEEQAYEIATKTLHKSEVYKKVEANSMTMVIMKNVNTVQKITLNKDHSIVDHGDSSVPFKVVALDTRYGLISDDSSGPGGFQYFVRNNHICQSTASYTVDNVSDHPSPGDVIIDGGFLYKIVGDDLMRYNLIEGGDAVTINIPGLIKISSLEIDGDIVLVEGLSDGLTKIKGNLNFSTGTIDTAHSNIMREIKIKAME